MKNFTAKQKEVIARKLGYDGPMQGFDEFVQSSPALAMKYEMISDKYTQRMAKGGAVLKYQDGGSVQGGMVNMPEINIAANASVEDKRRQYSKLLAEGFDDAAIRTAAESKFGKQSDADWQALSAPSGSSKEKDAADALTKNADIVAKVRERFPNYDPNKMTMDFSPADQYYDELMRGGTAGDGKKRIIPADRSKETGSTAGGGNAPPPATQPPVAPPPGVKINIDPATATPQQKAAEYNRLRSQGYNDDQIKAVVTSQFGAPAAEDWSKLQEAASKSGTTIPEATPGMEYGETGVPKAGAMQRVQAQQTAVDTGKLTAADYNLGAVTDITAKTGTAQQMTTPEAVAAQTMEAAAAQEKVKTAVEAIQPVQGQVTRTIDAAQGQLSEAATAKPVEAAEAAKIERVAPLEVTPEMQAKAVTVEDVGGMTRAEAEQSRYQSQIEAQQRQVSAEELVDVEKQKLQMETVQAVAATMDKLNADAVALAAQGNLFAGQAEAQQGRVQAEMTLRGQLEKYMSDFNDGTPAWAAGAIRAANAAMAARGLAGSSMAGAAILQAAMEAATPLAAADAQVFSQMELTNLNNRQQVALANAAAAQQMELANLNARQQAALQNSANAFSLQSQNLSNTQATILANAQLRAAAAEKNLDVRTQAAIVNAARIAEVNNINLSNSQQAMLARSAENLQVDLANLSARQQTAIANAQIEASLKGQEMSNRQQVSIANAARVAEIAQTNFTAEQNRVLTEAKFINDIRVQDMSNKQAVTLANAAAAASMDIANLNARQQANVENAKAFLAMDMANLEAQQQTALFKGRALVEAIASDTAAENVARQTNATNKQQAEQFSAKLAADAAQFNTLQHNAMQQFNVGEENALARFNAEMDTRREEFNSRNRVMIDTANAQLQVQISTANTAAVNAANFQNAQAMNNMTLAQYNNEVQLYRDQVKMVYDSFERAEDRAASMATAVLQADIAREQIDAKTSESFGRLVGAVIGTETGKSLLEGAVDIVKNFFKPG